jgi:hypothetical protein
MHEAEFIQTKYDKITFDTITDLKAKTRLKEQGSTW